MQEIVAVMILIMESTSDLGVHLGFLMFMFV